MTQAYSGLTSLGHGVTGGAAAPQGWTNNLRRAWTDYKAYRLTLSELGALEIRQLDDLGFAERPLKEVARNAVYGN